MLDTTETQQTINALKHDLETLQHVKNTLRDAQWRYKKPTAVMAVVTLRILAHRAKIVKLLQKGGEK